MKEKPITWVLMAALIVGACAGLAKGQTCNPPIWQGSINATGSCGALTVRWLNRDSSSLIDHYAVTWQTDGLVQIVDGAAITASRHNLTCEWSSRVTVTQFMKSGASCATNSTGAAPHTPACSLCSGPGASSGVSVVSAANYRGNLSRGAIAAIFPDPGVTFTTTTERATVIPLPVILGGVSVTVSGIQCGLFYVSPNQINFQIPESVASGPAELPLTVLTQDGRTFYGKPQVNPEAPGVFTVTADGTGRAAVDWYGNQVVSIYGTGSHSPYATLFLTDGRRIDASYAGQAPGLVGLNQFNFFLPRPSGVLSGWVRVWADACRCGGYWDSNSFDLR